MATIKATTIDALPDLDSSQIGDDLNVLIQSASDGTKTNKTTLRDLKTYFGANSSGGSSGGINGGGSTGNYVINEFNLGEFASEIHLTELSADSSGVCEYHSGDYTSKCDQEIYAHLDVTLTCSTDMWSYQDSYIAIELKMRNTETQDQNNFRWYKICQKPLCDCGTRAVRSIDFHMCLQGGMTIRATVFGGSNNTTTAFGIGKGTQLNLVVTSTQELPQTDYSTYLYVSSGNPTKTISCDQEGDFAVGVWALGSSSVASNMNITISTGGDRSPVGRVATYTAGKDIGEVYIGSFYFPKGTNVTIGLNSDKYTTTTPVYLRLSLIKDNIPTTISEIKKVTSDSIDSLKIEASDDFELTGITHVSQYDTVQFHSDHGSTGVTEFNGVLDTSVIESKSHTETKLGTRTLYYQDVFTNFCNGTTTSGKNSTITSIRFNKSYSNVPRYAFYNCSALKTVDFGSSSASSIGDSAFQGCTSLSAVNFNSNITTIGNSAFYNCNALTKVFLPIGVKTLNAYAFRACTGLKEFYIPYDITTVNTNVLYGVDKFAQSNQLYVIIPSDTTSRTKAEKYISDNSTALGTLWNVAGFKQSDKKVHATLVLPSGDKFKYTDEGVAYNLVIVLDSATATPVCVPSQVS